MKLAAAIALVIAAQAQVQVQDPTTALLRRTAAAELAAGRAESAQALLAIACWRAPSEELRALEDEAFRALRAGTAAKRTGRSELDLREVSDSPYEGLVFKIPGATEKLRTGRRAGLTLTIDGEELVVRGTSVRRTRTAPGEFESDRLVLFSDDERFAIEGRKLSVIRKRAPAAAAGRLLASDDARERQAGRMLYPIRSTVRALERINDQREASGLLPIGLSAELSQACALHARYLAEAGAKTDTGTSAHDEAEGSPWYSAEGARAGRQSCISYQPLDCAVVQMMATFYHRVPMLEPGITRVGMAEIATDEGYVSVIDVVGTLEFSARRPVMAPGAGQTGVPVRFASAEVPDPRPLGAAAVVGYPVTLSWYGGGEATAELRGPRGEPVECWVSTPAAPAHPDQPQNQASVCLLPKQPLARASEYTATVRAGERTWSWSFVTR